MKTVYVPGPFSSRRAAPPGTGRKDPFTDVINDLPNIGEPDPEVPEGSVRAEDGSIIKLEGKPTDTASVNNPQDPSNKQGQGK